MLSRIFLTVYRLDGKNLVTLSFGTLIPYGVVWAEIEYIVHVVLPIGPINQFSKADNRLSRYLSALGF